MIVSENFVFIHTSRTGGTFLNNLILEHVPGARMLQYHGHLGDLPGEHSHLPVIGIVRNPWDWYVSMYNDYRRKGQYVYQIVSKLGALGFEETVRRFLTLGDDDEQSRRLLRQVMQTAPDVIDDSMPQRFQTPGLRQDDFAQIAAGQGYYSWLFELMFASDVEHEIHIGRFEQLRDEALRLFELTGTKVTDAMAAYLQDHPPVNASPRDDSEISFSEELRQLVAERDRSLIERYGYECPDSWS